MTNEKFDFARYEFFLKELEKPGATAKAATIINNINPTADKKLEVQRWNKIH